MLNKVPGLGKGMRLQRTVLDLSFSETFKTAASPTPTSGCCWRSCEGNPTLFIRRDEVEQAWTWVDSIHDAWQAQTSRRSPTRPAAGARSPSVALLVARRPGVGGVAGLIARQRAMR